MTDLLTSRQVQDILKVDRITIYRMLQDGRLKGVKIGSQWRFPQEEVERILNGKGSQRRIARAADSGIPTHCVQTIQNLLSGISRMCALVLDTNGDPITEYSAQPGLSRQILSTTAGWKAYQEAWHSFAANAPEKVSKFTCPLGLSAVAAPIHERDSLVGWFLVGQVFLTTEDRHRAEGQAVELADRFGLNPAELIENIRKMAILTEDKWSLLESWAIQAAQAVDSILLERTGYKLRLQQIADLTQMW